jgi:hypothetical protein
MWDLKSPTLSRSFHNDLLCFRRRCQSAACLRPRNRGKPWKPPWLPGDVGWRNRGWNGAVQSCIKSQYAEITSVLFRTLETTLAQSSSSQHHSPHPLLVILSVVSRFDASQQQLPHHCDVLIPCSANVSIFSTPTYKNTFSVYQMLLHSQDML